MSYAVKEVFYTLQGEGANAGKPAVFCRFTGCNLWSGREEDRASAACRFCDTDFVGTDGPGGGRFRDASELAGTIASAWPGDDEGNNRFVVFTGGEPTLQLDAALIDACHERGFFIAVETNGTRPLPAGVDWVCVSPKAGTQVVVQSGSELKVVFPQTGAEPEQFESLEFEHYFLQPMDGPDQERNTGLAVDYCLQRPRWRLSLQTHKLLGIA